MKKRAVIYCRTATTNEFSLDTQEASCRRFAEEKGYEVVMVFREVGSGMELQRPELTKLRILVMNENQFGKFDAVICYSQDRISRNIAHGLMLEDDLNAGGTELRCVKNSMFGAIGINQAETVAQAVH